MAKISTLQDDFNDGVIDTSKWTIIQPTQWSETTTLNALYGTPSVNSCYVTSIDSYDVTNDSFSFKFESTGSIYVSGSTNFTTMGVYAEALSFFIGLRIYGTPTGNKILLYSEQYGNGLYFGSIDSYDETIHKYFKITFGATTIDVYGSSDGITYNLIHTESKELVFFYNNFDETNVKLRIEKKQNRAISPNQYIQISYLNHIYSTPPKGVKLRGKCKLRGNIKIR